jgi:hypothetical protein
VVDSQNMRIAADPKPYLPTMVPAEAAKEGYVMFKIDAPNDITSFA